MALSNLVPCRKVDEYLHPVVDNAIKLKGLSFYVAGTTDGDLIKEEHLYDLFVDLQSRQITVSPKAEGKIMCALNFFNDTIYDIRNQTIKIS